MAKKGCQNAQNKIFSAILFSLLLLVGCELFSLYYIPVFSLGKSLQIIMRISTQTKLISLAFAVYQNYSDLSQLNN